MAKEFHQKQKNVFWIVAGAFLIAALFFTYVLLHNQYLLLGSGKNQGCGMVYDKLDNSIVQNGERVGYPVVDGRQTAPDFKFNGHPYNVTFCSDGLVAKGAVLYYYQADENAIADCLASRSEPFADLQDAVSGKCDSIRHHTETQYVGKAINATKLSIELLLYWLPLTAVLLFVWKRYIAV